MITCFTTSLNNNSKAIAVPPQKGSMYVVQSLALTRASTYLYNLYFPPGYLSGEGFIQSPHVTIIFQFTL